MPVIPSSQRVDLGYEGRLHLGGTAWHESATSISINTNLSTASARTIGQSRNNMIHLSETSDVQIEGFQLDKDVEDTQAIRDWKTPHLGQVVVWGERGLNVVNRANFLPVIGQSVNKSDSRDELQTVTLSGVQAGDQPAMFDVQLESPVLARQVYAFTTDFATSNAAGDGLVSHTLNSSSGATEHFFVLIGAGGGPIPSGAQRAAIIACLQGISGFGTFQPSLSRWRVGLVNHPNPNRIKPLTDWTPLTLTPHFEVCIGDVSTRQTNEFYGFQLQLVPRPGQTAPRAYSIALRGSTTHAHI